jgi:hypothetical protein
MTGLLDISDLVVKRRPRIFERRAGYDLLDLHGTVMGSVEQAGRDNLEKALRPSRSDNARSFFDMCIPPGSVALRLTHLQALKSSLSVDLPDGSEVGSIHLQNVLGKSRFALEAEGAQIGTMTAKTWRKRSFVVADQHAVELVTIDMTRGRSGDHSHQNEYVVRIDSGSAGPFRLLAVATVIAVDTILWNR